MKKVLSLCLAAALALSLAEMRKIRDWFARPEVREARTLYGLGGDPTDAEVEAALAHWKGERTFPANDFRKVRQGIASQRAAEFVEAHSPLLPPPEEPVLETIA